MLSLRTKMSASDWLVPAALVALCGVPVLAGSARLAQFATADALTGDAARYNAEPAPLILHIIAASTFGVLGALQFAPNLRRGGSRWHRVVGRIVLPWGLLAALTGLWMTQFYARIPSDSAALYATRMLVGCAMLAEFGMAISAIRQRNFRAHGAWMVRAYALGLGAGTQVFTHLPWFLFAGIPGPTSRAFLMAAGWLINVLVAEWIVRRSSQFGGRTMEPVSQPYRKRDEPVVLD